MASGSAQNWAIAPRNATAGGGLGITALVEFGDHK